MDSNSLNNMRASIYIPSKCTPPLVKLPEHHRSLILQDYQTDTTHTLSCGCHTGACIEEQAWWMSGSSMQAKVQAKDVPKPMYKARTSSSSMSVSSLSSSFN